jgi:hypothetical protein
MSFTRVSLTDLLGGETATSESNKLSAHYLLQYDVWRAGYDRLATSIDKLMIFLSSAHCPTFGTDPSSPMISHDLGVLSSVIGELRVAGLIGEQRWRILLCRCPRLEKLFQIGPDWKGTTRM